MKDLKARKPLWRGKRWTREVKLHQEQTLEEIDWLTELEAVGALAPPEELGPVE